MAGTLPIGHWSWHERWLYPDQIHDLPDRPLHYARAKANMQQQMQQAQQQQQRTQQQQQQAHAMQSSPHSSPSTPPSPLSSTVLAQSSFPAHLRPLPSQQRQMDSSAPFAEEKQSPLSPDHPEVLALNNPQAVLNQRLPHVPRRYRDGTLKRTTSEYAYTYREPRRQAAEETAPGSTLLYSSLLSGSASARSPSSTSGSGAASSPSSSGSSGSVPGSRLPARSRGKMGAPEGFLHHHLSPHYWESAEDRARVRPEQHSFRLWGRINTAHCSVPFETESQRAFRNSSVEHATSQPDRRHFLRVEQKEYKEAMMKARLQHLIRGAK